MKISQMGFLIVGMIIVASAFGCSKKEEPAPATVQEAAPPAVEVPELEQNKLYQNNQPEWAQNPDTSFVNGPDNLEQPSEEDLLFDEPAGD